jgi:hypothetical protein
MLTAQPVSPLAARDRCAVAPTIGLPLGYSTTATTLYVLATGAVVRCFMNSARP